jgi:hypothetical protein
LYFKQARKQAGRQVDESGEGDESEGDYILIVSDSDVEMI